MFCSKGFIRKKRVARGTIAKRAGDEFESKIEIICSLAGVTCAKIPNGMAGFGKSARRVRTPFDFIAAKNGKTVLFDAKSTSHNAFNYSDLTPHQIKTLSEFAMSGLTTGYLIYYRPIDQVVFFKVAILKAMKPRDSIKPSDGLILGRGYSFNIGALFDDK